MKHIKSLISFSLLLIFMVSCNKDDFNYPSGKVGISTIVYFPSISLNGSSTMIITAGSAFTDPGVVATVNGQAVKPTISGSVNANTPGIYWLTYTAQNTQGFTSSVSRIVIVKSASPVTPDYSGSWTRNAGAYGTQTWIQLTSTTYAVSDPGGANYTNFWCVVTINGTTPVINSQSVPQTLGGNPTSISTISSTPLTGTASGSQYTWAISTSGFGTGNRTFVKQ